jgi:hypothetical protein
VPLQSLLSSHDAAPVDAALYGLGPLVLADQVVFPGQAGVYSVPRLSPTSGVSAGEAAGADTLDSQPQPLSTSSSSPAAAAAAGAAAMGAGPSVHNGSSSSRSGQPASPSSLLFSLSLPAGVAIHGWDMMDLKDGVGQTFVLGPKYCMFWRAPLLEMV